MKNSEEFNGNLRLVLKLIEDFIDDDNILKVEEFEEIQRLKRELDISSEQIHDNLKAEIDRILYLQLFLLLLDDDIDNQEHQEIDYYKEVFGYSEDEIIDIEIRVREDKKAWKNHLNPHCRSQIINA